jgi:hypothetical protein
MDLIIRMKRLELSMPRMIAKWAIPKRPKVTAI